MLLVTVIPFNALAETDEREVEFFNGYNFKATFSESTKTLTISGEGSLGKIGFDDTFAFNYGNPMEWDENYFYNDKGEDSVHYVAQNIVIEEGITAIVDYMFYNFKGVKNVTLPSTLKRMGKASFLSCTNMISITGGKNVTQIDGGAFMDCKNLKNISFPNLQKLDDNDVKLFSHYNGFEDGTDVCLIGDYYSPWVYVGAFMHCQNLESVYIPKVKKFGDRTFFDCTNLSTVNIPKLKKLHSSAWKVYKQNPNKKYTLIETPYYRGTFEKCVKLKKITSSSLANVGKYDFKDCTRLVSITLGKNLKSIGDSAFNNDRKLKSVNIKSTKLSKVGKSAFSKIHSKAKFTVPQSKLKKYKKLIKSNGKAPKNVKFIAK